MTIHQTGKRRVVVVMCEREGWTLPYVFQSVDEASPTIQRRVLPGITVYADEASCWDALHARFAVRRVSHSVVFSGEDASTNQAESYFSRLCRAKVGTHHHINGQYLNAYANEMAWRENNRCVDNGSQYLMIARAALA